MFRTTQVNSDKYLLLRKRTDAQVIPHFQKKSTSRGKCRRCSKTNKAKSGGTTNERPPRSSCQAKLTQRCQATVVAGNPSAQEVTAVSVWMAIGWTTYAFAKKEDIL